MIPKSDRIGQKKEIKEIFCKIEKTCFDYVINMFKNYGTHD